MKQFLTLAAVVLCTIAVKAQRDSDIPGFGKVDKKDLEKTACDFDKNAEAEVLFDVGEMYCILGPGGLTMELQHHVRIKILKDKGLDRADIRIRYHSYRGDESIKNLSAQTYNLDASGNVVATKVEKKLIYDKKINKYYSEQVFTFPEAKAGSIIEYKYTHTNVDLLDWSFQRSIPVKYSRFRIDFPRELEVHASPICVLPYERKADTKGNRDIQVFSMTNIPALRDEPYISSEGDYLQRIETRFLAINPPSEPRISLVSNWPRLIKSLMENEDFGIQLKKNIPRTTDLDAQLKTLSDPYQKMVAIYNYVRKNMEPNEYTGIYTYDGVRAAWKDKKGTGTEINMILVNLLKDAGLNAHALLASTREHGRVNTSFAEIRQFNKVLANVLIGDKNYILDATDKFTPPHLIPLDVMYSEGLVIEKLDTNEWGWTVIWDNQQQFKNVILMNATVNEDGVMKGEASVNSYDYSRVRRMPHVKKGKDHFMKEYFNLSTPGASVDELTFENEDADSMPLVQRVKFTQPVSASGDYKYFSVNMFTGLESNPFVADSRFSDVFFGANQSYMIVTNITIPDGYTFEALPKSIRMIMPDTSISITRRIAANKNQLSARISLDFKKPFYTVGEYPDFKEFYKKLFDLLNEQIAIRKETNP